MKIVTALWMGAAVLATYFFFRHQEASVRTPAKPG